MIQVPKGISIMLLMMLLVIVSYPFYGEMLFGEKETFFLQKLTAIVILAIFAISLDLLVGVTGLVSLGHALFFGLTGYALALLSPEYEAANLFWILPASLAICGVVALVVGILSIRTSGIFFIMVTLAFGQMGYYLVNDSNFAGGSDGMYIMMKPVVEIGGWQIIDLDNRLQFFYFSVFCLVATYLGLRMLLKSPFGRVLVGIHSNENRVAALGYNTNFFKVVCFVIGGVLAGLAGFLAAVQYGYVNPEQMTWHQSGHALMMVIMGGAGTLYGAILGAFAFEILHYIFESLTEHWLLLMGGVMITVVLLLPHGLAGALVSIMNRGSSDLDADTERSNRQPDLDSGKLVEVNRD